MILRRLLENLLNYGVVCVVTSNRHPDDLYKNGIQRSSFVPAIELLKTRFEVTDLDSGTDYRRIPRALSKVFYHPLTPTNELELNKIFKSLTSGQEVVRNRPLSIWGRTLKVPESSNDVAKFHFDDLCGKPLSAADYIEVTKTFPTVFLLDIPKMGLDSKDKVNIRTISLFPSYRAILGEKVHHIYRRMLRKQGKSLVLVALPILTIFTDKALRYLRSSYIPSIFR